MGSKSVAEAPNVLAGSEVNKQLDTDADPTFDQRLDVIRRSALQKNRVRDLQIIWSTGYIWKWNCQETQGCKLFIYLI